MVYLNACEANVPAVRLYRAHGFVPLQQDGSSMLMSLDLHAEKKSIYYHSGRYVVSPYDDNI